MTDNEIEVSGATLAGIELFSDMNTEERNGIAKMCRGHRYQANELIVSYLDNTGDVFFIVSGIVRVTIYSKSGKEITFRDIPAGHMFGELSAIDGKPRSAHVIALDKSSIVFVSTDVFWELLSDYPDFARKTLIYLANLVRLLSDRVVEFSTLGVKNRIHAELLRLGRDGECNGNSVVICPAPTHSEIANRVSTHREAVTREMGILTGQGIIRKKGKSLIIHDLERLEKIVFQIEK